MVTISARHTVKINVSDLKLSIHFNEINLIGWVTGAVISVKCSFVCDINNTKSRHKLFIVLISGLIDC